MTLQYHAVCKESSVPEAEPNTRTNYRSETFGPDNPTANRDVLTRLECSGALHGESNGVKSLNSIHAHRNPSLAALIKRETPQPTLAVLGKSQMNSSGELWQPMDHAGGCLSHGVEHRCSAERFGSGDGERKTLLTRQIAFEPLPESVLLVLSVVAVETLSGNSLNVSVVGSECRMQEIERTVSMAQNVGHDGTAHRVIRIGSTQRIELMREQ